MALPNRQQEFNTVISDLMLIVRNADTDLAALDPDSDKIQRIKKQAQDALGCLGFNSPQPD